MALRNRQGLRVDGLQRALRSAVWCVLEPYPHVATRPFQRGVCSGHVQKEVCARLPGKRDADAVRPGRHTQRARRVDRRQIRRRATVHAAQRRHGFMDPIRRVQGHEVPRNRKPGAPHHRTRRRVRSRTPWPHLARRVGVSVDVPDQGGAKGEWRHRAFSRRDQVSQLGREMHHQRVLSRGVRPDRNVVQSRHDGLDQLRRFARSPGSWSVLHSGREGRQPVQFPRASVLRRRVLDGDHLIRAQHLG